MLILLYLQIIKNESGEHIKLKKKKKVDNILIAL